MQGRCDRQAETPETTTRRPVGRPPRAMPSPIPDTLENVAQALLTPPPKRPEDWAYLRAPPQSR